MGTRLGTPLCTRDASNRTYWLAADGLLVYFEFVEAIRVHNCTEVSSGAVQAKRTAVDTQVLPIDVNMTTYLLWIVLL